MIEKYVTFSDQFGLILICSASQEMYKSQQKLFCFNF